MATFLETSEVLLRNLTKSYKETVFEFFFILFKTAEDSSDNNTCTLTYLLYCLNFFYNWG